MTNEVAKMEEPAKPMTAQEMKEHINIIQRILNEVMKKGTHYDALPGCGGKPVLLKPGAEKILATFRIGVEVIVEDLSDEFDYRYRVICRGFHIPTGNTVGFGIGEASTGEKKYKWRIAVCDEEYNETPETRRQIYYSKDRSGTIIKIQQVRQNPADLANTVLKMAKKRAMVDLCLTVTACSDVFVQDLDDPDSETPANPLNSAPQSRYSPPSQKGAAPNNVISEPQRKRLYAIGKQQELTEEEMSFIVYNLAGVNRSQEITLENYDKIVAAFSNAVHGKVIPEENSKK